MKIADIETLDDAFRWMQHDIRERSTFRDLHHYGDTAGHGYAPAVHRLMCCFDVDSVPDLPITVPQTGNGVYSRREIVRRRLHNIGEFVTEKRGRERVHWLRSYTTIW